jgi:hypothetical protein
LEASSVATHLLGWLEANATKEKVLTEVLMKDLLQCLTDQVTDFQKRKEPPGWPRSPQALSAQLKRYAPALRREGWDITYHPHSKKGRCVSFVKQSKTGDEVGDEVGDELHHPQKFVTTSSLTNSRQDRVFDEGDEGDELFCSLYIQKKREERRKREEEKRQNEAKKRKKNAKYGGERGGSSEAPKSSSPSSLRHHRAIVSQNGLHSPAMREPGDEEDDGGTMMDEHESDEVPF